MDGCTENQLEVCSEYIDDVRIYGVLLTLRLFDARWFRWRTKEAERARTRWSAHIVLVACIADSSAVEECRQCRYKSFLHLELHLDAR